MKPLLVLLGAFLLLVLASLIFSGEADFVLAGNAAMSIMLLFTAIAHFAYAKGMAMMIPGFIPYKKSVVFLTGLAEIAAAIGLLVPHLRSITSFLLILFFVMVLPANIHAARKNVDYQKATREGNGPAYLWFRVPLQVLFILWVWFFGLHLQ